MEYLWGYNSIAQHGHGVTDNSGSIIYWRNIPGLSANISGGTISVCSR